MPETEPIPDLLRSCARAGQRYRTHAVQDAAQSYDRQRHLPRIVHLSPETIADTSLRGTNHIVEKLEEISRNLARAARERHWCYDTNRHIAVLGALMCERATLAGLETQQEADGKAAA